MAPAPPVAHPDKDAGHAIRTLGHRAVRMHGLPRGIRHHPGHVADDGHLPIDPPPAGVPSAARSER